MPRPALYFLHSTSVLSFYIDIVLILSIGCDVGTIFTGHCSMLMTRYFCVQQSDGSRKWYLYAANLQQNMLLFLSSAKMCMWYSGTENMSLFELMPKWWDVWVGLHIQSPWNITANQKDDSDFQLNGAHFHLWMVYVAKAKVHCWIMM